MQVSDLVNLNLGNVAMGDNPSSCFCGCGMLLDKTIDPFLLRVLQKDFRPQPDGEPPHGRAACDHTWAFVDKAHAARWWSDPDPASGGAHLHGEDLFPVLTPDDDLPKCACDRCGGDGHLHDGATCSQCGGEGEQETAPFPFCSHDPAHAAHAQRFDRNHMIWVMGRPASDPIWSMLETVPPNDGDALLACGHVINEWWKEPADKTSWSDQHLTELAVADAKAKVDADQGAE